jgi:hypothetical protein
MITKTAQEFVKEAIFGLVRAYGLTPEDRELLREYYGLGGGKGGLMMRNEGRSMAGSFAGGVTGAAGGAVLGGLAGAIGRQPALGAVIGGNIGSTGGSLIGAYKGSGKYSKENVERIRAELAGKQV